MSVRLASMVLIGALWLLAAGSAGAAEAPRWAATEGPYGGTVQALQTLSDDSVIAGTLNGGVFYRRSLDGHWQRADWPLAVADVRGFAASGNTLYAVSNGGGIAASQDAGASWVPLNTRSFETEFATVASRDNFILIGARRGVLLRSYDAGVSWQRIRIRQTRTAISAILITDDTVWVATNGGGVFVSHDRALSFRPRLAGLRNRNALSLAQIGDEVLVGTRAGVYRFEHDSWQPIGRFARRLPVVSLLATGDDLFAGTIGGGVLRHSAADGTWQELAHAPEASVTALAQQEGTLLAATFGNGITAFADDGWRIDNLGLTGTDVRALATNRDLVYAATDAGMFKSPDYGSSWFAHNAGLTDSSLTAVAVSGLDVYAASNGGNLFKSVDEGERWTPLAPLPDQVTVRSLAVANRLVYAATERGIFISKDAGNDWELLPGSPARATQLATHGNVLIATDADKALFVSDNRGESWQRVTWDERVPPLSFTGDGKRMYAVTAAGLVRSIDNGRTWKTLTGAPANSEVRSLAFNHPYLVAGTRGSGVLIAQDGGLNWHRLSPPIPVNDVLVSGDEHYLAASDGVYKSVDGGQNWAPVNSGLKEPAQTNMLLQAGERLYVATDAGLFASVDRGTNWSQHADVDQAVHTFALVGGDIMVAEPRRGARRSGGDQPSGWIAAQGLEQAYLLALQSGKPMLAATTDGVFQSIDGGRRWDPVAPQTLAGAAHGIARNDTHTYVLVEGALYIGDNNLSGWSTTTIDSSSGFVHSVATRANDVFVATDGGLFQSQDNGRTWIALQQPGNEPIHALRFSNEYILAAGGDGVWSASLAYGGQRSSSGGSSTSAIAWWTILVLSWWIARRRSGGAR
ncbi:MAG: hypothetical protein OET44_10590 [Gammaproteobacteria bacterium]|nr:hypothetical protein [Gammaproteobacteria bacterium]